MALLVQAANPIPRGSSSTELPIACPRERASANHNHGKVGDVVELPELLCSHESELGSDFGPPPERCLQFLHRQSFTEPPVPVIPVIQQRPLFPPRRFFPLTVEPLAGCLARELTDKLETSIELGFSGRFAADLTGRARAFQSMVGGGMDAAKAASLAGLMAVDG